MEDLLKQRTPLANLPTPVHYFPRISRDLGIELYVKRDDLTESVASGNKIRKLEYLLRDALDQGADTLVTCGGNQSNHCRATAWAAARQGLSCVLLLREDSPPRLQGNLLLDRLLGAEARFYSKEAFADVPEIGETVCEELRGKGRKPYFIPTGGSNATGALGYARMVRELAETGENWDHLYCALGSGGTFAGLWTGVRHWGLSASLRGVAVCDDAPYFLKEVSRIAREMVDWYGWKVSWQGCEAAMDDGYVGTGYALNTPGELRELARLARLEGLVLDPVYTLKAFLGMADHVRRGLVPGGARVLFLHSGGHSGLFAKSDELREALGDSSSSNFNGQAI